MTSTLTCRHACGCKPLLAALLATAALAGCGGGDSGGPGGGPTGLVPTPPALGATLFADTTVLRPLAAGASWQYAGVAPNGDAYANAVTQAAAAPGVTESTSNTFDRGAGSVHIAAVNGNIVQPDPVDADGDGIADIANVVELRSPVQVNDQFVAFDQRIPGVVPDIDGDGKAERLDLAIYTRVVGAEDIALAGLPTQHAVRVDRVTLARIVLSKDDRALPTVTSTQSVWYAPVLGIVRRRLNVPSDSGLGRDITDERLTAWAGLPG